MSIRVTARRALLMTVLGIAACGSDTTPAEPVTPALEPLEVARDCNPIAAEWDCLLPYPSDVYLVADDALESGRRVTIGAAALPAGVSVRRLPADGFSIQAHVMALFPAGVDAASLGGAVLVEAETGYRPMVLTELDPRAKDPARQAVTIRALERLKNGTRYVVGFSGLTDASGDTLEPPEGFRRIRDGVTAGDPVLEPLAARYETGIFDVLEEAGVAREALQLAWDFTTQTRKNATADMLAVRAQTMAAVEAAAPAVTVTEVTEPADGEIGRRIMGTITVPQFMSDPEAGATLLRDANGAVQAAGTVEVPFTVMIPRSVLDGTIAAPVRLVQYGHGFFGERTEIEWSYVRGYAQEYGVVFCAVDWAGMHFTDKAVVADKLFNDPDDVTMFVERVHQGMANQIALSAAMLGSMQDVDELKIDDVLAYDPARFFYHGLSQGHILGGTFFALSPHHVRAALGVGGAGFTHMMMRSANFNEFLALMNKHSTEPLQQAKIVAMTATDIDRFDPLTYAPYVFDEPLEGAPAAKQVLMQIGIGDAQVPNLTSRLHARALSLPLLAPPVVAVAPLNEVSGPHAGSAYIEYDYELGLDPLPGELATPPTEDNEVHEAVRRTEAARAQLDAFLQPDGVIEQHCEGPCNPQ